MNRRIWEILFLSCLSVAINSCSGSSSSSDSASTATSALAQLLAEEMVLASPTAKQSSALMLEGPRYFSDGDVVYLEAPSADDSAQEKKEALEKMLSSTPPSSCAISINTHNAGRANCYGPSVNYTNHDSGGGNGSWPGGDLGIWEESEIGEACSAAQLNAQMKGAISYIDAAQFITAGVACVATKKGSTLPASGATLDLTADMAGQVSINGTALTVTLASIARASDDASGNPVYVTTIEGAAGSNTYSIRLKHIPTSSDDSTNKGKISIKAVTNAGTDGLSLSYEKTSATEGKMLLKKINSNNTSFDPFVSSTDFTVDYSKAWNNNADYFLALINPSNYTGVFSYAWQAGNGDSHSRVFNAKISESSGSVTGSAFFGFGPTMQAGPGSIAGMICAWTGPDSTHTPVSKVQRQNIELSAGKFIVSGTSNTVFDPVADCESTQIQMNWNNGQSTRNGSATTENLSNLTEVSSVIGTLPAEPTNID